MLATSHIRIARPTNQIEAVVNFYTEALGFEVLGRFDDHDGFDGVMLGFPGSAYHLEFTHCQNEPVLPQTTSEDLLVFYVPDKKQWQATIQRLENLGVNAIKSTNPYWDRQGQTYADPDGYRIVIQNQKWP